MKDWLGNPLEPQVVSDVLPKDLPDGWPNQLPAVSLGTTALDNRIRVGGLRVADLRFYQLIEFL